MKLYNRIVHLSRSLDGDKKLMIKLRKFEAEKLVKREPQWSFVSKSIYRDWVANQPTVLNPKIVLPEKTKSIKVAVDDRAYATKPTLIEIECGTNHKELRNPNDLSAITDEATRKIERKRLARQAFIRQLTTVPIEKVERIRKRNSYSQNPKGFGKVVMTVVAKEDIRLYKQLVEEFAVKRNLSYDEAKRMIQYEGIMFEGIKYRTIEHTPYTAEQQAYLKFQDEYDEKVKNVCVEHYIKDLEGNDIKDSLISVKINPELVICTRAKRSNFNPKKWKHQIKVKADATI